MPPTLPPLSIHPGRNPRRPAGPAFLPRLLSGEVFRATSADLMLRSARDFGDLVYYRAFGRDIFQLNHPSLIQSFFTTDSPHHHRNLVMQRARTVLGHGLLTSEEPLHMRQRRLAQPAFLRDRIEGYGAVIGRAADRLTSTWRDGETRDLHPLMLELALRIVGKCLFDLDNFSSPDLVAGEAAAAGDDIAPIASAVDAFMGFVPLAFVPFSRLIERSPLPSMRRLRAGKLFLDTLIEGMIADRRADPTDRGDLLSMLLSATDPDPDTPTEDLSSRPEAPHSGAGAEGPASRSHHRPPQLTRMTDQQVHDECVTILLAGHETTANALSFALHLLATHPAEQELLAAEARSVLGPTNASTQEDSVISTEAGHRPAQRRDPCISSRPSAPTRSATAADYPRLPYSTAVFAESMRLFPPVWVTARTVVEPYEIAGYPIPRGAALLAPQFAVHRDPRLFPDPTRFDPTRFLPDRRPDIPRYAYFPFAGGSRQCIAEGLAWMEGTLTLSTLLRDWQLSLPPGAPTELALNPAVSLRPRHGIPIHLTRRP